MNLCMGRKLIWVICAVSALFWCGTAVAQYNPYAAKKPAVAPAPKSGKAKGKSKKVVTPPPPPPQVVKEISVESGLANGGQIQETEPTPDERLKELEGEVESLKLLLARAGISKDTESLSPSQRQRIGDLERRLQKARADHKALLRAVDEGLDFRLVQANLKRLERRMENIHQQMEVIRRETPQTRLMEEKLAESEARIEILDAEVAKLRTRLDELAPEEEASTDDNGRNRKGLLSRVNELLPVEIFAFGDFMYVVQEDGPDDFTIGQLELDITQDLIDQVSITAAIAYDSDSESFGLGAFTIDGRILGADDRHLRLSKKIDSLGVILGKFDVPFGIDYMEYASIARRLVTGPLVVDETHGRWNDLGGQLYLIMPRFNTVVYAVNGFSQQTVVTGPADEELIIEHPTAMAVGARVGVLPVSQLELGGSFAGFFNPDAELSQMLAGGDAALNVADFELKGEYIFQKQGIDLDRSVNTQGFYAGALYDFKPVFVTGRYSQLWCDNGDLASYSDKQLSVGFGVAVFENAEVRFEYSTDLESGGSTAFIQLAGGTAWQPSGLRR